MSYEKFKIPTPEMAPRVYPAWRAMLDMVDDWRPHLRKDVEEAMLRASDIRWKTVEGLVYAAIGIGLLEKVGDRSHLRRSVTWTPQT